MKQRHVLTLTLTAILISPIMSFAHDEENHSHSQKTKNEAHDDSMHNKGMPELLANLDKTYGEISTAVQEKKLGEIHELSESLAHIAGDIAEQAPEDKKARVSGSAKNIASLSHSLHDAADKNDRAQVEIQLKKLGGMIKVFRSQAQGN